MSVDLYKGVIKPVLAGFGILFAYRKFRRSAASSRKM